MVFIQTINKQLKLTLTVWKQDRRYVSQCPEIGISSFGNTRKEALKQLQKALDIFFKQKDSLVVKQANSCEEIYHDVLNELGSMSKEEYLYYESLDEKV